MGMLRAYDYECPNGHKFEMFLKDYEEYLPCPDNDCAEMGRHVWSFYYNSANAQPFSPVVIHKDANGNFRFPASTDAPIPPGFQKVELTNVYQIRELEREVNRGDREKAERFRISKQALTDGQLAENRRVMTEIVKGFSPRGKRFYDRMKQMSQLRQKQGPKPTNPEFVVDAFSHNQSNREGFFDERITHGSHRGSR